MIACVLIFHLNCTILLLSPGNILRLLRATNVVCFKLENWYALEGAWSNSLYYGGSLVRNFSHSGYKHNFHIKYFIKWHNKGHNIMEFSEKFMMTKRKMYSFLSGIKNSQLSLYITSANVSPLFTKNYELTM